MTAHLRLVTTPPRPATAPDVCRIIHRDVMLITNATMCIRTSAAELAQARDDRDLKLLETSLSDLGTYLRTAMRLWVDMTVAMKLHEEQTGERT